jgi:class 3 adenylate cyclase
MTEAIQTAQGPDPRSAEALRTFVAAPLAHRIARGEHLGHGECRVSVLFVDLRDYARLAEERSPREIFAFLSAYSRRVSEIVAGHGGWIVEFSGDGLMAVFGAPAELPARETSALLAGRAIVEAMAEVGLTVGVGIATGSAYVGTLPSVDRLIWCAVGNTTILASRLQGLSRDLGASLVIDSATREGVRPPRRDRDPGPLGVDHGVRAAARATGAARGARLRRPRPRRGGCVVSRIFWRAVDVIRLALALQEPGRGLCVVEIQERFEVSRRTAERMRATVALLFPELGYELGPDRKRYWKLRRGDASALMLWTLEELVAVEAAIHAARQLGRDDHARALLAVAGKIRTQIVPVEARCGVARGQAAPAAASAAAGG